MKNLLAILFLCSVFYGCTQKPAAPAGNRQPMSRPLSQEKKRQRPPMPSETQKPAVPSATSSGSIKSASDIFEQLSPAVFKIHTSTGYQGFQGSGFFISDDGLAVSNYHVFEGTAIGLEDIILNNGRQYKVKQVYHKDKECDFIIFKVDIDKRVKYIPLAKATPKIGEKVYTIGSPRGLDNTFSSGEISQIRGDNSELLQISAPIDHGSSGGVLLNTRGEAIGITTSGLDDSGANLNFAINISLVKPYIR